MTNKEAIKLIQEIEEDGRNVTKEHIEALNLAIKALEERPTDEWIEFDDGSVACPVCGTGTSIKSIPSVVFFRYCPYCGAKLGKGVEENEQTTIKSDGAD